MIIYKKGKVLKLESVFRSFVVLLHVVCIRRVTIHNPPRRALRKICLVIHVLTRRPAPRPLRGRNIKGLPPITLRNTLVIRGVVGRLVRFWPAIFDVVVAVLEFVTRFELITFARQHNVRGRRTRPLKSTRRGFTGGLIIRRYISQGGNDETLGGCGWYGHGRNDETPRSQGRNDETRVGWYGGGWCGGEWFSGLLTVFVVGHTTTRSNIVGAARTTNHEREQQHLRNTRHPPLRRTVVTTWWSDVSLLYANTTRRILVRHSFSYFVRAVVLNELTFLINLSNVFCR